MGEVRVKDNVKPVKPKKRKMIWWRVLLAWLGGFIFFPISVVGAGALLGTVFNTKQVVSLFGGNPEEIVGEEYLNKTILESVMSIVQGFQSGKFETLEGVATISPKVKETVEVTVNDLIKGILGQDTSLSIRWDDIKDKKFTENGGSPLADEVKNELLDGLILAEFIQDAGDLKGLYNYFLYPTVKDLDHPKLDEHGDPMVDEQGNIIYEDLVDEQGHTVFDTDHPYSINYFVNNGATAFNGVIDKIMIGDVVDAGDNPFINAISTWRIGDMESNVETLEIGQLFTEDQLSGSPLLSAIEHWTINDFSDNDKINSLTIGQLFTSEQVAGSNLLTALSGWSLNDFSNNDKIDTLKIGDLIDTTTSDDLMKSLSNFYIGNLKGYEMDDSDPSNIHKKLDEYNQPISWEITAHIYVDDVAGDTENTLIQSFYGKTIKEMMNMDMNSIKLADVLELDVYEEFTDTTDPHYAERHGKFNSLIHAVMDNKRHDDFEAAVASGYMGNYQEWLNVYDSESGTYPNRAYSASINDLSDPDLVDKLKLSDVLKDIDEGTILYSYKDKTIGELSSIDVSTIKLADILEKDVYEEYPDKSDPRHDKFNQVIHSIMDNDRRKVYDQYVIDEGYTGTYEQWLELDAANKEYPTTVGVLSDPDTIQGLKIEDVITINEGSVLNSIVGTTIGNLGSLTIDSFYLKDLFEEDVYKEFTDTTAADYDERHAKFNKIIAGLMKNDEWERYHDENPTATREYWEANVERTYDSKASILTDQNNINNLAISDVLDKDSMSGIARNVVDALDEQGATLSNMGEKMNGIQVGKLFGVPTDGSGYKPYGLYTDEEKADTPYVLYSLRDATLGTPTTGPDTSLTAKLGSLTIGDAMPIYRHNVYEIGGTPYAAEEEGVNAGKYYYNNAWVDEETIAAVPGATIKYAKSDNIMIAIANKGISDSYGIVYTLKNGIKLGEIIHINSSSPKILQNLKHTLLSDIEDEVESYKLRDIMEVYKTDGTGQYVDKDGNVTTDPSEYVYLSPIIGAMADVTILNDGELQAKMDNLKFNEVFTEEQCEGSTVLMALWTNNGNGDFKVTEIGTAMQNVHVVDVLADDIYLHYDDAAAASGHYDPLTETYDSTSGYIYLLTDTAKEHRKIDGKWWFLLTEEGESFSASEKMYILKKGLDYKISDMTQLVNNMSYHIQIETLFTLHDVGILTCDRSKLEQTIPTTTTQIGSLTIEGFINAIAH